MDYKEYLNVKSIQLNEEIKAMEEIMKNTDHTFTVSSRDDMTTIDQLIKKEIWIGKKIKLKNNISRQVSEKPTPFLRFWRPFWIFYFSI